MIAMCHHPLTAKPEDVLKAERAMQTRYWFADVHCHGRYPEWLLQYQKNQHYDLDITADDLKIAAGQLIIGFSYYMSFATKDKVTTLHYDEEHDLVPNPYVRHRNGAGKLIQLAYVM